MANRISLTAADGHAFDAFSAAPEDGGQGKVGGGVIFLQAIYGLTPHLGDVCDRFAADGYAAVAPALYDRTGRGKVFGYEGGDAARARAFRDNLREDTVLADVAACAAALRAGGGRVAISGFCTGGTWAWIAAAELDFDAAAIFYGSDVYENLDRRPRCPTLLHYGDADHVVPMDRVEAIRTARPECELHVYPGCGHAFYNPDQASHDAAAAQLAHARTVAFLARHLRKSG